jgi:4'-phosphopantetheinyl transferase
MERTRRPTRRPDDPSPERWDAPPARPAPAGDEVHVWRARLDLAADARAPLHAALSAEERARAARFHDPADGARFAAARGLLRAILARYLDRPAAAVAFAYGAHGKPELAGDGAGGSAGLRFNASHAGALALYAVARGRAVGVDVERARDVDDADDAALVAERYFAPAERAALRAAGAAGSAAWRAAFLACWTRKEAYAKARGVGLSIALDAFAVALGEGAWTALDGGASGRWTIVPLAPGAGYAGALAVEGEAPRVRRWAWDAPAPPPSDERQRPPTAE